MRLLLWSLLLCGVSCLEWKTADEIAELRAEQENLFVVASSSSPYDMSSDIRSLFTELEAVEKAAFLEGWDVSFVQFDLTASKYADFVVENQLNEVGDVVVFRGQMDSFRFEGEHKTSEKYIKFLRNIFSSIPAPLEDEEELARFEASAEVVIVSFFSSKDHFALENHEKLLSRFPSSIPIAYAFVDKGFGQYTEGYNIYHRAGEYVDTVSYSTIHNLPLDDVVKLLRIHARPYVERFPQNATDIFNVGVEKVLFYFDKIREESVLDPKVPVFVYPQLITYIFFVVPSFVHDFGRSLRGRLLIAFVDFADAQSEGVRSFFEVNTYPTLRGFITTKEKQYRPSVSGPLGEEDIRDFIVQFDAGTLAPYRKMQPLPANWDKNPVKILTGENFDKVVLDRSLNVLVLFYAPWCGHCKRLHPVYEELAKKLEAAEELLIAKVDATENDVETQHPITGYPTIILFTRENLERVYGGAREVDAMLEWILTTMTTTPLNEQEPSEHEEL